MRLPAAVLALLALGCRPAPEEAPVELDDLVHFFLAHVGGEDAVLVGQGAANLGEWFDSSDQVDEGWATGTVTDLTLDEVEALDDLEWEPDPSLAVGVFILTELDCSLAQMEEIYLEPDQLSLFPGNYKGYERSFDTDPDCFPAGTCHQVLWHSDIEDSIAGFSMTYSLNTVLHRLVDEDGVGEVVLARNLMPEPAVESVAAAGFEQSYHIETWFARSPDRVLHLYGLWNHGFLTGFSDDASFWANQYIDGLVEWDERIQEICTEEQ